MKAARPNKVNGESPGRSGLSPSADGDCPAADNNVDVNGVTSGVGCGSAGATSCTLDMVTGDFGATSTTVSCSTAGAFTDSTFGCVSVVALWVVTPGSPVVSLPDGVLIMDRFGFFGAAAASEVSEPDFLFFTTGVDFLFVAPSLPTLGASSLDASWVAPLFDLATSPLEVSEDPVDPDDSVFEPDELSDEPVEPDEPADEELDDEAEELESVPSADATPGIVAIATPTPNAIASPPTRPM